MGPEESLYKTKADLTPHRDSIAKDINLFGCTELVVHPLRRLREGKVLTESLYSDGNSSI